MRDNNKFIENYMRRKSVKRYSNKYQIIIVMLYNRIKIYSYIVYLYCNWITSMKLNKIKEKDNNLKTQN